MKLRKANSIGTGLRVQRIDNFLKSLIEKPDIVKSTGFKIPPAEYLNMPKLLQVLFSIAVFRHQARIICVDFRIKFREK